MTNAGKQGKRGFRKPMMLALMLLCMTCVGLTCIPGVAGNTAQAAAGPEIWDGTEYKWLDLGTTMQKDTDGYYLISSPAEYIAATDFCYDTLGGYADLSFRLTTDIWLNDTTGWEEWASYNSPQNTSKQTFFNSYGYPVKGVKFDGNGHTIYGMYSFMGGLMSNMGAGSVIENLTIKDSYIQSPDSSNGVGVFANSIINSNSNDKSKIINCNTNANVERLNNHHWLSVGGIVGAATQAEIRGCEYSGKITTGGSAQIAGIVGTGANLNITGCVFSGEIIGYGANFVSGIYAGTDDNDQLTDSATLNVSIDSCYSTSVVDTYAGSAYAIATSATIRNTYAKVSSNTDIVVAFADSALSIIDANSGFNTNYGNKIFEKLNAGIVELYANDAGEAKYGKNKLKAYQEGTGAIESAPVLIDTYKYPVTYDFSYGGSWESGFSPKKFLLKNVSCSLPNYSNVLGTDLGMMLSHWSLTNNGPAFDIDEVNGSVKLYPVFEQVHPVFAAHPNSISRTYNGNQVTLEVTTEPHKFFTPIFAWYKNGAVIAGATASVLTLDGNVSDSGKYYCVAAYSDYSNSETSDEAIVTINPKSISLTWTNTSLTYNKTAQKPDASATGVISGDSVTISIAGEQTNASASAYRATASTTNGNYTISNATQNFTIGKATATVTWGTTTTFTYNKTAQAPTATAKGVGGETVAVTVGGAQTNVGSYNVTLSTTNANYTLNSATKAFTINPKSISVTWTNTSLTYNKTAQKPSAVATGVIAGDTVSINIAGEQTNASASAYTATASTTNGNYTISNATQSFTIGKATATVTWGTTTTFTYNKTAQAPTATAKGVGGEAVTVTVGGAQTNVGSYNATLSTANANYNLNSATKAFTINPKSISVTWTNTALTYNKTAQKPSAAATGVIAGDSVPIGIAGEQTNASASAYTATASTTNGNYTISNPTQSFTIGKATATVTWGTTTAFTYNKTAQAPTATAKGVGGETVAVTVGGAQTNVGSYTATLTTTNANYTLNSTSKAFTINPKSISVTWTNTSLTYNKTAQKPSAVATGVITGDSVPIDIAGEQTNASASAYTATASTTNGNYTISNPTQSFTIGKATVTLTQVSGQLTKAYDGKSEFDLLKDINFIVSCNTAANPLISAIANFDDVTVLGGLKVTAVLTLTDTQNFVFVGGGTEKTFEYSGKITKSVVTVTTKGDAPVLSKIYDGSTSFDKSKITNNTHFTVTATGKIPAFGSVLNIASSVYNSANVANANAVSAIFALADTSNYEFDVGTISLKANITKSMITVTAKSVAPTLMKVYDGNTAYDKATLASGTHYTYTFTGKDPANILSINTATYNNANVASANAVSVVFALSDMANYGFTNGTISLKANVTKSMITVSAKNDAPVLTKVYDGNVSYAKASLAKNTHYTYTFTGKDPASILSIDTATFNDANVKSANAVSVVFALSDLSNYGFTADSISLKANITKAQVVLAEKDGYTKLTKIYDAATGYSMSALQLNTHYTVTCSTVAPCTVNILSADYNTKNVGANKVNVVFGLSDANNYEFEGGINYVDLTSAEITPVIVTIAKAGNPTFNKIYDGSTFYNHELLLSGTHYTVNFSTGTTSGYSIAANYNDKNVADARAISAVFTMDDGLNFVFDGGVNAIEYAGTISKKAISFTWSGDNGSSTDFNFAYNNASQCPVPAIDTGVDGDTIIFEVKGAQKGVSDSAYLARITLTGGTDNYIVTGLEQEFTIERATYDMSNVVWSKPTYGYDGTTFTVTILSGLPTSLNGIAVVATGYSGNSERNKGNYTARVTGWTYDTQNYFAPVASFDWEILAREVTVTIDNQTSAYGESFVPFTWALTSGTLGEGDGLENLAVTVNKADGSIAGGYALTGSSDSENYTVIFNTDAVYTVTQRKVTVTIDDKTSVYGQPFETLTWALKDGSSYAPGENAEILNVVLSKADGVNATTYAITGEFQNANYDVTFEDGVYTISPKAISVTVDDKTTIYGDELVMTWNLAGGSVLEYGDTIELLNVVLTQENRNFGSHNILTAYDNANYDISFNVATHNINKRNIKVGITNLTSVYGDPLSELGWVISEGTLASWDTQETVGLTFLLTNVKNEVGYYVVGYMFDNSNYMLTFISTTYTVTTRELKLTVDNKASVYGDTLSAPAFRPADGYSYGMGDSAESIGLSVVKTEGNAAGEYTFIISCDNTNYRIFTEEVHTISPKSITVKINNASSVYGDGFSELTWQLTADSLLEYGEIPTVLNVNLMKEDGLNVGEYTIGGLWNNGNYAVTFDDGEYAITPKAIAIIIDDKQSVYGESLQTLTWDFAEENALAYADTRELLNVMLAKAIGDNVGPYVITGGYDNANYSVTFTDGVYTVINADFEVTVTEYNAQYDGAEHTVTVTLQDGDAVYYSRTGSEDWSENAIFAKNVSDSFEIFIKVTRANHNDYFTSAAVSVTPKVLDVSWTGVSGSTSNYRFVYNGNERKPAASVLTGVEGETLALNVIGGATNASATAYLATATFENGNYALSNPTHEFFIDKATMSLTTAPECDTETTIYTSGRLPEISINAEDAAKGAITWDAYVLSDDNLIYYWTFTPNNSNYNLVTGSFTFRQINKVEVDRIEVTAQPSLTEYRAFDTMNAAGIEITVFYNDGKSKAALVYSFEYGAGFDSFRYGDTTVTVVYTEGGEYKATIEGLVIGRKQVEIPVAEGDYTYNGSEQTVAVATNDGYDVSANTATSAGTHHATVTLIDGNYEWTDGTTEAKQVAWEIKKSTLEIVPACDNVTPIYTSGSLPELTLNEVQALLGTVAWDDYTLTAGENAVFAWKFTPSDTDNYNYVYGTVTFASILQSVVESVTVEGNLVQTEYDAFKALNTDGLTVTVLYSDGATKTITNYVLRYLSGDCLHAGDTAVTVEYTEGEVTVSAEISGITVNKLTVQNPDYSAIEFTYNSFEQGIGIDGNAYYTVTDGVAIGAGRYNAVIELIDADNYKWTDSDEASFTIAWEILKATVERPVVEGDYTYIGKEQTANIAQDSRYEITNDKQIKSGSYKVTVTLSDFANYKWIDSDVAAVELDWKINKAFITKPTLPVNHEFTFDGSMHTLEIVKNDDLYTVTNYAGVNAGAYTLTFTLKSPADSSWMDNTTASVTYTWNILKAELAIPTVVGEYVYNGSSLTAQFSASGAFYAEGHEKIDAGAYKIKLTLNSDNYQWTGTEGRSVEIDWTIAKAKIEKPGVPEKNEFVYNWDEQVFGIALNDLYTIADNRKTTVGSYVATVTLNDTKNTEWADGTADVLSFNWNITKAKIEKPEAPAKNVLTYNCIEQILDIANSDNYTVSGNKQTIVGNYVASVTLVDTENTEWADGSIEEISFDWEIIKAVYDISQITFTDKRVTYNCKDQSIMIGGEWSLPEGVSVTYLNNGKTNVGTYLITAKFAGDAHNYELIDDMTATLTIVKATYDMAGVTFTDSTVVYDGKAHDIWIAGTLPVGVSVTYENNGQINYGTYIIKAKFTGDADNYELIADMTATLKIQKQSYDMRGVTFEDETVIYNGTVQTIKVIGNLPDGVSVSYSVGGTTVGTYTITATFTGDADNYELIADMTATLTITKATYEMDDVTFVSDSLTYNGAEQNLAIVGTLPSGVTVSYSVGGTTVGTYTITATFAGDADNYELIADMTATLTIEKAAYDMSGVTFENDSLTYNGAEQNLSIVGTLPSGVTVSYSVGGTTVGTYTITATFTGDADNYELISDMTATLTIDKATYDMAGVTFEDKTVIFNGNVQTITVVGNLPDGVSVTYTDGGTNAGRYTVTASFVGDEANYNLIEDMTAQLTINVAKIENTENGVIVEGEKGINPDYSLSAKDVSKNELDDLDLSAVGTGKEVKQGFEITLSHNNVSVQPDGKITIKLLISEQYRTSANLKVYYVDDNGKLVDMNSMRYGDYMMFDTTHLSRYVIVGDAPADNTVLTISLIAGGAVVVLLAIVLAVVTVKKRKKETK